MGVECSVHHRQSQIDKTKKGKKVNVLFQCLFAQPQQSHATVVHMHTKSIIIFYDYIVLGETVSFD